MKDIRNQNTAQMEKINELTNGAPYELWMANGGAYVVMVQKIASVFAHAAKNICEANRMSYPSAAC